MTAINKYGAAGIKDPQIFEYDKTLSLPIDKAKNTGATIGSVVSVGATFGVMVSEIGLTDTERAEKAEAAGFDPVLDLAPAGYNAPGYASVRVKGGAFLIKGVQHTSKVAPGTKIFAKQESNKVVVSTSSSAATHIGFAYQGSAGETGPSDIIVVLLG